MSAVKPKPPTAEQICAALDQLHPAQGSGYHAGTLSAHMERALRMLSELPKSSANYDEAQRLIARLTPAAR